MRQILDLAFSGAVCLFAAGLCFIGAAYGEHGHTNNMKVIEGSIWYRERMALPPDAEIHIFLEDVAQMDVPSDVIATTSIAPRGGPPWGFSLAYDPGRLHDRGRYALRARIEAPWRMIADELKSYSATHREV